MSFTEGNHLRSSRQPTLAFGLTFWALAATLAPGLRAKDQPDESKTIESGLRWLARHQDADGRWSSTGFGARCGGGTPCGGNGKHDHDVGITGLSLLAFLGAGHLPSSKFSFQDPYQKERKIHFGETMQKGLRWLLDRQDAEGCVPERDKDFMYDHAIATLAMARAARISGDALYRGPAQKAVDFLLSAQNPGSAWRYVVRPQDNDTSVTGWCVQALKEAERAKLKFDRSAYEGVRQWLRRVTNAKGVVGYEAPGDPGSVLAGINEQWQVHPTMTGVGLFIKLSIDDQRSSPWLPVAAQMLVKDPPSWDEGKKSIDYYYWHCGTLALLRFDGPRGPAWRTFSGRAKEALLSSQNRKAGECREGSWEPGVDKWGSIGGRVYATAINLLTLEAGKEPRK
jgi:hypothetical protein